MAPDSSVGDTSSVTVPRAVAEGSRGDARAGSPSGAAGKMQIDAGPSTQSIFWGKKQPMGNNTEIGYPTFPAYFLDIDCL